MQKQKIQLNNKLIKAFNEVGMTKIEVAAKGLINPYEQKTPPSTYMVRHSLPTSGFQNSTVEAEVLLDEDIMQHENIHTNPEYIQEWSEKRLSYWYPLETRSKHDDLLHSHHYHLHLHDHLHHHHHRHIFITTSTDIDTSTDTITDTDTQAAQNTSGA
jgi:hypothetical protein